MNCFSPDCADFIDDDKKEKLVEEYQNEFNEIRKRGYYYSLP